MTKWGYGKSQAWFNQRQYDRRRDEGCKAAVGRRLPSHVQMEYSVVSHWRVDEVDT